MNPDVTRLSSGGSLKEARRGARPCASFSGSREHGRPGGLRESRGSSFSRRTRRACPTFLREALCGRSGSLSPSCRPRGRMGGSGPPPATAGRTGGRQPSPCRRRHTALHPPGDASVPGRSSLVLSNGTPGGNRAERHRHTTRWHSTCTSLDPPSAIWVPAFLLFYGFFGLALFRPVPAPISPSLFARAAGPPQPFSPFSRKGTGSLSRTGTEV